MKRTCWSGWCCLTPPPDWLMEETGDTITFAHPNGVGAVTISMYSGPRESEKSAYDLAHRFSEQLGEVELTPIRQGRESATIAVRKDGVYWRVAAFRRSGQAVLITYTCDEVDKEEDLDTIEAMLSSFEWDG